jgi:hypothetical protein
MTGNGTSGILIARPQWEIGTSVTTAQRVGATAFDITEAGQTSCYYLQPDGVNDGYVTGANLDLSGTDKVTVFAAFRKTTDAAVSILAELSASRLANNGAFTAASTAGPAALSSFASKGTSDSVNQQTNAAPTSTILTGIGNISTDTNIIRFNGVQIASVTTDQGTGNYGSYPLYLFSRGGVSSWGNAQCFALIVAGGSYSTATIQRVEQILSKYTPGVTL